MKENWEATGGEVYLEFLEKFEVMHDPLSTPWLDYVTSLLNFERHEAVMQKVVSKESKEVRDRRMNADRRPPTLSPDKHLMNQLTSDWDAEEDEIALLELEHPPGLELISQNFVIDPREIGRKMLSVREVLADELREDLGYVEEENMRITRGNVERVALGSNLWSTGDNGAVITPHQEGTPRRIQNYRVMLEQITVLSSRRIIAELKTARDTGTQTYLEKSTDDVAASLTAPEAQVGGNDLLNRLFADSSASVSFAKRMKLVSAIMTARVALSRSVRQWLEYIQTEQAEILESLNN